MAPDDFVGGIPFDLPGAVVPARYTARRIKHENRVILYSIDQ